MIVRVLVTLLFVFSTYLPVHAAPALGPSPPCKDRYWSWEEAQTALEMTFDGSNRFIDLDQDGIACEDMLDWHGFAPAWWTDQIPSGLVQANVLKVKDGDTLVIEIGGQTEELQFYRTDAPEEYNETTCGAAEAAEALETLFDDSDNGWVISIEKDVTSRDIYGRLLGYAWIEYGYEPLLINEAMIRSGWAADRNYGDERYDEQMRLAEDFAWRFQIGTWQICPNGPNPG